MEQKHAPRRLKGYSNQRRDKNAEKNHCTVNCGGYRGFDDDCSDAVAAARNIDTPSPAMTYPYRYVKAYTNRVNAVPEAVPDNAHPSYAPPVGGSGNTQTDAAAQTDEFTAALIDSALDEILSTDECFVSERQYIDDSPDAFLEITALGERALPYLESIASGADEGFRPHIAMAAMYKISPELYDREFVSPDGRYTLRAEVYSFYQTIVPYDNICYRLRLVDNATGYISLVNLGARL